MAAIGDRMIGLLFLTSIFRIHYGIIFQVLQKEFLYKKE